MALAAIQISLLATGVPAFLRKDAMMAHRSAVSSLIARTLTRGDWRNSHRDLSFSSALLPSRNPAFNSPKTIGVR